MNTPFKSQYQEFIYKRTYSRWLPEQERRENWDETVHRYVDFWKPVTNKADRSELFDFIYNLKAMPSMRALMTAGPALERDHMAGYNCAAIAINHQRCFDEAFFILMCGTGLGFSVERQYTNKLPTVADELYNSDTTIVVRDSKIGWACALKELIAMLYNGQVPKWNLDKVRPAGSRLKTFGGRSSGPEPLDRLFRFTVNLFNNAVGRKLNSLECHDLVCQIADTVIVGGVRRSACISLSNLSDDRMRRAKTGQWWAENPQRALANNSAAYTEKPDMDSFFKEWYSLYRSRSGERGIINKEALREKAESCGREYDGDYLLNPCFTGDMELLTSKGYRRFDRLVDCDNVFIVNSQGDTVPTKVWCSGEKDTVALNFRNRNSITLTPDHKLKLVDGTETEAINTKGKRLMPYYQIKSYWDNFEAFTAGFIQGDGNTTRLNSKDHKGLEVNVSAKDKEIDYILGIEYKEGRRKYYSRKFYEIAEKFQIPAEILPNRGFATVPPALLCDFFGGLFTANGTVISNTRVSLKSMCITLVKQVASLLKYMGIETYYTTNKAKRVMFENGEYLCKESYDLNIYDYESILKFAEFISFGQQYKRDALLKLILNRAPLVSSVVKCGVSKVYDFTEDETHWGIVEGVVAHNCGEAILRDTGGLCNLTEVVVRHDDTLEDLKEKVRVATILGTLQASLANFRYVRKVWQTNAEEERLLGVSLTGIMDHPMMSVSSDELVVWLKEMREVAKETNLKWAKKLKINPSKQLTLVKPSGTVSQLVDASSGIHPRYSKYYIRNVRCDISDPIGHFLADMGINYKREGSKMVLAFPVKCPNGSVCVSDIDPLHQLKLWETYRDNWCEGNPSQTIYYTDDTFFAIADWVWRKWDKIGGLSFFPKSDHIYDNAPYVETDEATYKSMVAEFPEIDWSELQKYEKDDSTQGAREFACAGGVCEL